MDKSGILVVMIVSFFLVVVTLVSVVVGSSVVQRRRYLRTREHLGARLLTAQDEERAAIARELHDDVVQRLVTATIHVRAMALPEAGAIATEFDDVIDDLRGLARGLHPSAVEGAGLDMALRGLCISFGDREDMTAEYRGISVPDGLLPPQRLALYRVAQEALGNVARHARVDRVQLTLSSTDAEVRLLVEDAGAGFDARSAHRGAGIGVTSMQERLGLLGGTLTIDSAPGKGTRVEAVLRRTRPA